MICNETRWKKTPRVFPYGGSSPIYITQKGVPHVIPPSKIYLRPARLPPPDIGFVIDMPMPASPSAGYQKPLDSRRTSPSGSDSGRGKRTPLREYGRMLWKQFKHPLSHNHPPASGVSTPHFSCRGWCRGDGDLEMPIGRRCCSQDSGGVNGLPPPQ